MSDIKVVYPWAATVQRGGAGSGNWGHTGRAGKRGGSGGGGGLGRIGGHKGMSHTERRAKSQEHREKRDTPKAYDREAKRKYEDAFDKARTPEKRREYATKIGAAAGFGDYKPARTPDEIPEIDDKGYNPSPRETGKGKYSVFTESNGLYSVGPVVKMGNDYYTGTNGQVRKVKPEFDYKGMAGQLTTSENKALKSLKGGKAGNGLDLTKIPGIVKGNRITQKGADTVNGLYKKGLVDQTPLIGPSGHPTIRLTEIGHQVLGAM